MKRKTRKTLIAALVLTLSILSINTLIFSVRLFRLSSRPHLDDEKRMDVLAKNFLMNKRLTPLVTENYQRNDYFLASFVAELIEDNSVDLLTKEYKGLFNNATKKFPENLFLAHFGLYEERAPAKDWQNFDRLALKLMREPRFNSLVFPMLTKKVVDKEIPDSSLPLLISYLNWMENFSLADDLLTWAYEKRIENNVYDSLLVDLKRRKKRRQTAKKSPLDGRRDASFFIPFENKDMKVEAGRNLIFDGNFRKAGSIQKKWTFLDISDTESYAKGSFYGHIDSLENNSLRVMGFFIKYAEGKGYPNGGLQLKKRIELSKNTYLFHFKYKTSGQSEIPSFWLAYGIDKAHRIEPADSGWKEVYYIFNNTHYRLPYVRPFLRIFGTGSAWFENIGLYKIALDSITVEQDALIIR